MPRASWKGFLRLSLVSCPVYLSPATTRVKAVRLHQVWVPRHDRRGQRDYEEEVEEADSRDPAHGSRRPALAQAAPDAEADEFGPASRIALRPHDPDTGEEIEREEVRRGYE